MKIPEEELEAILEVNDSAVVLAYQMGLIYADALQKIGFDVTFAYDSKARFAEQLEQIFDPEHPWDTVDISKHSIEGNYGLVLLNTLVRPTPAEEYEASVKRTKVHSSRSRKPHPDLGISNTDRDASDARYADALKQILNPNVPFYLVTKVGGGDSVNLSSHVILDLHGAQDKFSVDFSELTELDRYPGPRQETRGIYRVSPQETERLLSVL